MLAGDAATRLLMQLGAQRWRSRVVKVGEYRTMSPGEPLRQAVG
jgi:hypothetical protein